jgi:hypothetical protein
MAYLTLFSGLFISAVAIYYSVAGLTSIFAAAMIPIIIMGTALEVSKLVATVWLKQYWEVAPRLLKTYLMTAVVVLMIITSMGIFGYLSKAHMDQTMVSGDVVDKVAIIDEKIKTQKDNIDAARKALVQMDAAVDQTMARSTNEAGATKAANLRRSQTKERTNFQTEIAAAQKEIARLNEERAPIAKDLRQVEAEVGPIKYIAAMIYGSNPDANILEKAVTWVIILIVVVFDPLAVSLLLASQYSFGLLKEQKEAKEEQQKEQEFFEKGRELARSIDNGTYVAPVVTNSDPADNVAVTNWTTTTTYEPDDGALTDEQIELIRKMVKDELPTGEVVAKTSLFDNPEDEFPFRGKGVAPSMPLSASYEQPKVEEPLEEAEIEEPAIDTTVITHTPDGMIVADAAGTQEIPVVKDIGGGYVSVNGKIYHHKAWDYHSESAEHAVEKHENTYVQNEEQTVSDQWSKIANKTISEEEYLEAARQKQTKKDA